MTHLSSTPITALQMTGLGDRPGGRLSQSIVRNYPFYRAFNGRAAPKIVIVLRNHTNDSSLRNPRGDTFKDFAIRMSSITYYVLYALRDF